MDKSEDDIANLCYEVRAEIELKSNIESRNPRLAYERLSRYKGVIDDEIDCKAELAQARDEKYPDLD